MHIVSSVSTVVRTCKDASVQVDQRVVVFLPGNKTIGSDAKSITHCEILHRNLNDITINKIYTKCLTSNT